MAKYIQKGEVIDHVASANLAEGDVVALTNCIGVAGNDIESGKTGSLYLEGIFEFDKKASLEISVGDKVYFNTTDKVITKTSTDVPAGMAVKAALAADEKVQVKIFPFCIETVTPPTP